MKRAIGSLLVFVMVGVGSAAGALPEGGREQVDPGALRAGELEPARLVPVIREVLADDHFDVVDAERTLMRKGFDPGEVAGLLAEALSAPERSVRRDAALMLLRLGASAGPAVDALRRAAAHDEDPVVRDFAREAVRRHEEVFEHTGNHADGTDAPR